MRAYDLSRYQRLVGVESPRVTGTFWVCAPTSRRDVPLVHAVDVTVWDSPEKHAGRVLSHKDVSAFIRDGQADLNLRSVPDRFRDDVEDVLDEMKAAMVAAAGAWDGQP